MSLKDRLFDDLKQAMKDKDVIKKEIVQIVRAGILQIEKDNKIEQLDDSLVIEIIIKEIKKLNDVIPDFIRGDRQDMVNIANAKIELLKSYLPEQLSEDSIRETVSSAIISVNAQSMKDMGKIMGVVSAKTKGRADSKLVSDIVKSMLQNI